MCLIRESDSDIVPADKASNNVVVICKKHYIEVIMKELNNIMGSKSTYQYVTDNPTNIINRHIKYMRDKCGSFVKYGGTALSILVA